MTARIGVTREQLALRRFRGEVRSFVREVVAPDAEGAEQSGEVAREVFAEAGRRGLLGLKVPEAFGGRSLPYAYTAAWIDELAASGAWGATLALIEHTESAQPLVQLAGSRETQKSVLEAAVRGELILALAAREGDGPGDGGTVRATATSVDGGFRIRGTKWVTANGTSADAFCVTCATDGEQGFSPRLNAFVVPGDSEGVEVVRRLERIGLEAAGGAEIRFEDCFVPQHHVLGVPGRAGALLGRAAAHERVAVALGSVAAARLLWETVHRGARETVGGGKPLAEHSRWRHRLAVRRTVIQAAAELAEAAGDSMDVDPPDLRMVSMARLFVSRTLEDLASFASELYGGAATLRDDSVGRRIAGARSLAALGGGPETAVEAVANLVL